MITAHWQKMEEFGHHRMHVMYVDFRGDVFLWWALPHKEQHPPRDSLVWIDAMRLWVLGINREPKSSHTVVIWARGHMTMETSNTSFDHLCIHKEGQPIEDNEATLKHKLNVLRTKMLYDRRWHNFLLFARLHDREIGRGAITFFIWGLDWNQKV